MVGKSVKRRRRSCETVITGRKRNLRVGPLLESSLVPLSLKALKLFPDLGRRSFPLHYLEKKRKYIYIYKYNRHDSKTKFKKRTVISVKTKECVDPFIQLNRNELITRIIKPKKHGINELINNETPYRKMKLIRDKTV